MLKLIRRSLRLGSALASLAAAGLLLPAAQAQLFHKKPDCCPAPCYPAPTTDKQPDMTQPPTTPLTEPTFSPEQAVAGDFGGFAADSGVGYIDSAIIRSQFRFRFDSAYDANRPDRAEFFYPKCGCFRINGIDPNAAGPPPGGFGSGQVGADTDVDYQEYSFYTELAITPNFSAFVEAPIRTVNFSIFPQGDGFGDLNFGAKAALINTIDRVLTFQFRTYTPTGDGDQGLGTEHFSLEPALLVYNRLSDRFILEGEFRYWIPIDGSDFAGDVIRYGVGLTYVLVNNCNYRILPVAEVVGWTVLDGQQFDPDLPPPPVQNGGGGLGGAASPGGPESADGDTIVNLKLGVRAGLGQASEPGLMSGAEIYAGYGRALTGEVWYKDIFRVELRLPF